MSKYGQKTFNCTKYGKNFPSIQYEASLLSKLYEKYYKKKIPPLTVEKMINEEIQIINHLKKGEILEFKPLYKKYQDIYYLHVLWLIYVGIVQTKDEETLKQVKIFFSS